MGKLLIAPLSSSNINSSPTASPLHHRPVSAPRTCVPELHIQSEQMICGRSRGFSGLLSLVVQAHKNWRDNNEPCTCWFLNKFASANSLQTITTGSWDEAGRPAPSVLCNIFASPRLTKTKSFILKTLFFVIPIFCKKKNHDAIKQMLFGSIWHTFCHIHFCQGHFLAKLPRPTASSPTSRKKWIPLWGVSWNLACSCRSQIMMLGRNGSFIFQIWFELLTCLPGSVVSSTVMLPSS